MRVGRRGSIYVRLRVNGIQGHTAFPENLDNPLHRLAPFLQELVDMAFTMLMALVQEELKRRMSAAAEADGVEVPVADLQQPGPGQTAAP